MLGFVDYHRGRPAVAQPSPSWHPALLG